jgi:hypothetical protein
MTLFTVFSGSHYGRVELKRPVLTGVSVADPSRMKPTHPPPGHRSSPKFYKTLDRPAGVATAPKHFVFFKNIIILA